MAPKFVATLQQRTASSVTCQAAVAAILAKLDPGEADTLRQAIEAGERASAPRTTRQDARDTALRAAALLIGKEGPYQQRTALYAAMEGFLVSRRWKGHMDADTLPEGAPALDSLLHRAASLNRGRGLSVTQIGNILAGTRTPGKSSIFAR